MSLGRAVSRLLIVLLMVLSGTRVVLAQSRTAPAPAAAAPVTSAPSAEELSATREQLLELLRMSPTLTHVVEVDPSVLSDQDYVARTNPQLAQFLAQHPEVSRNPDFFLFANFPQRPGHTVSGLRRRTNRDDDGARLSDQQLHREYAQNASITLVLGGGVLALLWLIRLLLENRRWGRLLQLQSDVHGKLIERFATNQELLHYMETEPGKRYLEAAPIPMEFETQHKLPGGLARVLGSLQIGIVLSLLGIGLMILRHSLTDIADALLVFGMVALMPGIGFIISAIISWRISARLGLLPQPVTGGTRPDEQR